MHVQGACHCGAIRFEAEVNPEHAVLCHCTDCQAMASAPYRMMVIAAERDFSLTAGTTAVIRAN